MGAQSLDDKYLFNLDDDTTEEHNLLLVDEADNDALIGYAKDLFATYLEHPLYSQNLNGLWNYLEEEDMTDQGVLFTDPWMTNEEYMEYIDTIIKKQQHFSNVPDKLIDLYTIPWVSPLKQEDVEKKGKHHKNKRMNGQSVMGIFDAINSENVNFETYAVAIPIVLAVLMMFVLMRNCLSKKKGVDDAAAVVSNSYGSV